MGHYYDTACNHYHYPYYDSHDSLFFYLSDFFDNNFPAIACNLCWYKVFESGDMDFGKKKTDPHNSLKDVSYHTSVDICQAGSG